MNTNSQLQVPTARPSTRPSSRLRRVCIVTETYRPEINGVANTLGHIVDGMVAQGIEVLVIRPKQGPQDQGDPTNGVETVLMPGLPIPGYGELRFGLPNGRRVRNALRRFDPDAVYVATEGPLGWVSARVARRLQINVVSGFHTNFHQYFSHYHLSLLTPLVYRYLRYFHNRTSATLAPTKALQQELSHFGFNHVQVMSRGVNAKLFSPQKRTEALRKQWGLKADELAVIYVGRLAAEKNLDLAVQAFNQMRSEDPRIKFILVGDGPLMARLKEDHPDYIFAGVQTGEALAQHYASADIFLFPSKTDTFGNVVLEAMASGLAVVSFDYAAAHQHIQHNHSGLLVSFEQPTHQDDDQASCEEEYVDAAQSLVHKPNLLKHVRQGARQHAESISWARIVEQFCQQLSNEVRDHGPTEESVVI